MTAGQFWTNVLALLLSPLIAVQVTVWLQRRREERQRKLWVFKTLMSTRAARLTPEHVSALNMIDIEFYWKDKKSKGVLSAWKAYLNHLKPQPPSEVWAAKADELFLELLYQLADALGFEFDKTDLKETSYFPQVFGDIEKEMQRIRQGVAALVEGKTPLVVTSPSSVPEKRAS